MRKFTIVCITIDFATKESATWILHVEAANPRDAFNDCERQSPNMTIISIFPGWHDEA